MSLPRTLRRLLNAREGVTAVEAAFVLPVLILLLFGIMEIGRVMWTQAALDYAVQEAARCAAVTPGVCSDTTTTAAYAATRAQPLNLPASDFQMARLACGVQVKAQVAYRPLIQNVFPAAPMLSAQICRA